MAWEYVSLINYIRNWNFLFFSNNQNPEYMFLFLVAFLKNVQTDSVRLW